MLVVAAYRVRDFQVIGGPNWINTDRFDIEAKAEAGANIRDGQTGLLMMQSLLGDRFQLKIHTETRELPTYKSRDLRSVALANARPHYCR